jgi:RNA polymerase sigma factor (TIGR02999 family)
MLERPADRGAEVRAMNDAFSLVYEELRRLASAVCRSDPAATINPTALVNEAWLKMAASPPAGVASPLHFKRIAARAMRQVLVEAARRRQSAKRGGGNPLVTFDESSSEAAGWTDDLVGLDEALTDLARLSERQAQLIECRFFGGLDVAETAALLNVSEATIMRDWRAAKAWLAGALRRAR